MTENSAPIVARTPSIPNTSNNPNTAGVPRPYDKNCLDGKCDQCLKGGLPIRRDWLTLVTLVLIAVTTTLFVLWVQEKRRVSNQLATPAAVQEKVTTVSKEIPPVKPMSTIVELPKPALTGRASVEEIMTARRSRRAFSSEPVTLAELSQILWSAQGITNDKGNRTAPSAHSIYPYTVYVVVRNVSGLPAGLYQYLPEKNSLGSLGLANAGDLLISAGVQEGAQKSPVVLLLSAAYGKMAEKFPNNAKESTLLEAGHIGQNIYLQVESLGMSTVVMGGFDAKKLGEALALHSAEEVVYVVPVGHRAPAASPTVKPVTTE